MKTFSALLAICAGNSPIHKGQWHGALMFFICALNKLLSKQSWGWWFGTPSSSLWPHCIWSSNFSVTPGVHTIWKRNTQQLSIRNVLNMLYISLKSENEYTHISAYVFALYFTWHTNIYMHIYIYMYIYHAYMYKCTDCFLYNQHPNAGEWCTT